MNAQKLEQAIQSFVAKQAVDPAHYKDEAKMRAERLAYYQSYTADRLNSMSMDDLYEYIGRLWSMLIWGNKKYVVDKIVSDNGFKNVTNQLAELLFGTKDIAIRWDTFLKNIKGMGPATISELLAYINPKEYIIFNKTTISCFTYLDVPDMPIYNYQYTGKRFVTACSQAKEISSQLTKHGIADASLLAVDYFLWDEVLPLTDNKSTPKQETIPSSDMATSAVQPYPLMHNDIITMIVEIGRLLGFESNSEIKVSAGAKVDAIWEAKIGNMGKAIYVFEVQSKGSIDSLLMNLMKAKNNSAVQAVVAVSDAIQIEKIKKESTGTILEHNLRTWDYQEVIEVYDALVKAHESINKLALVPDSFI